MLKIILPLDGVGAYAEFNPINKEPKIDLGHQSIINNNITYESSLYLSYKKARFLKDYLVKEITEIDKAVEKLRLLGTYIDHNKLNLEVRL